MRNCLRRSGMVGHSDHDRIVLGEAKRESCRMVVVRLNDAVTVFLEVEAFCIFDGTVRGVSLPRGRLGFDCTPKLGKLYFSKADRIALRISACPAIAESAHSGLEMTEANDQQWVEWREQEIKEDKFGRLFPNRNEEDLRSVKLEDYKEARFKRDREFIKNLFWRFKRAKCSEGLPMFCWIVDDEKAVFQSERKIDSAIIEEREFRLLTRD
jgi:hypothetical protein